MISRTSAAGTRHAPSFFCFLASTMSRRLFLNPLLRGISDVACEIQMLTSPHQPSSTSKIQTVPPFHLPNVQAPAQYLIDMGLSPPLARHLSSVYMDSVIWCRQVFESYFCRAIEGTRLLHPEHYHDVFVIQFKDVIRVLHSRIMSTALDWLCQAGLPSTLFSRQHIAVRIPFSLFLLRG